MRGTYIGCDEFDAEAYVFPRFTSQEKKCLNYLILGYQAKEISERLDISKRTAEKHLASVRVKMGCFNNVEVVTGACYLGPEGRLSQTQCSWALDSSV